MSRLSNRVQKLETGNGLVNLPQLQRTMPGVDLSILSQKHLVRFAEIQRDNSPRDLASFSNRDLRQSLAFSILFTAHATGDEVSKARAIAALDGDQDFSTDELQSIVRSRRETEDPEHAS